MKIFSEGGEGPALRPDWVQFQILENRRGSGPPFPTPSGFAHDFDDNISNQMTTGVMVKKKTNTKDKKAKDLFFLKYYFL